LKPLTFVMVEPTSMVRISISVGITAPKIIHHGEHGEEQPDPVLFFSVASVSLW
jgi:hypothetical protein